MGYFANGKYVPNSADIGLSNNLETRVSDIFVFVTLVCCLFLLQSKQVLLEILSTNNINKI